MLKISTKLPVLKNLLKSNQIYLNLNQRFLSDQQTTNFGFEEVKTSEKQTKGYLYLVMFSNAY